MRLRGRLLGLKGWLLRPGGWLLWPRRWLLGQLRSLTWRTLKRRSRVLLWWSLFLLEGLLRLGSEELLLLLLRHRGVVESVHNPPLGVHVARDPDEGDAATQLVLYPLLQRQQFLLHLPDLVVDLLLLTEQILLRLRGSHELLESLQVLQLLLERRLLELDLLLLQLLGEEVGAEGVDVGSAPDAQEDEQEAQHGCCSTVCE